MSDLVDIHLNPDLLMRYRLPVIAYPIAARDSRSVVGTHEELNLPALLRGLQERSRAGNADWEAFEPAISRIAELLGSASCSGIVTAECAHWWIELGPVDLNAKLVTVQRGDHLIAAINPREDGRLRVAVFRPLDGKSADYLTGLGQTPDAESGVCMRENNWEYALDCSAGSGNFFAAERGEAYLSYWENGLGIDSDGAEVPHWLRQLNLVARPGEQVAAELWVHHHLFDEDRVDCEHCADTDAKGRVLPVHWRSKRQHRKTVKGRFSGCLLGGAVGDALGAPVEFMKRHEILRRFGSKGITGYAPAYGGVGRITDDTQMTLFTAEGLIRAWVRGCFKGITTYSAVTAHAYLRWLQTQGERPSCDIEFASEESGWLFKQSQLHSRRAPGNTCLAALRSMRSLGEPATNDSKGCGGVMRVAPVGLFAWRLRGEQSPQDVFRLGVELAALTHGHRSGVLPAGVFALLVLALTDGASLPDAIATATGILRMEPGHDETLAAINLAESLARSGRSHE